MIKDSIHSVSLKTSFWIVIPAAGTGTRMQSSIPKQYIKIDGFPVLTHTISQFLQHPEIAGVMVAIAEGDSNWKAISNAYKNNNKLANSENMLRSCVGGKTRMDSVLAGLNALEKQLQPQLLQQEWVLVHDAARPGINLSTLDDFLDKLKPAQTNTGYILGQPVSDTLKLCNVEGEIESTLERSKIWAAQTPQAFQFQALQKCLQKIQLENDSIVFTDESSAMEQTGSKIKLVVGNNGNFKITTAEDITRMEFEIMQQLENAERVHPDRFFKPMAKLEENT